MQCVLGAPRMAEVEVVAVEGHLVEEAAAEGHRSMASVAATNAVSWVPRRMEVAAEAAAEVAVGHRSRYRDQSLAPAAFFGQGAAWMLPLSRGIL